MDEETSGHPVFLTLGAAARTANVSKSTLHKAVKAGKLSAERNPETNSFRIHVAELGRYIDATNVVRANVAVERRDTPPEAPANALETQLAVAEAQLSALKVLLDEVRTGRDRELADLRQDRDHWRDQAERLWMALPKPAAPVAARGVNNAYPPAREQAPVGQFGGIRQIQQIVRRSWWRPWRRSA